MARSARTSSSRSSRARTSSAKRSTATSSTAKKVRSGRHNQTKKNPPSSRRKPGPTARKTAVRSARSRGKTSRRTVSKRGKKTASLSGLSALFMGFVGLVISALVVWFFILPSVLLSSIQSKNILYVSNNINLLEGKILFAHFGENFQEHAVYVLDGSERVVLPNGYGEYAIGALHQLLVIDGQSEENSRSLVARAFGVPIDSVVSVPPLDTTVATPENTEYSGRILARWLRESAWQFVPTNLGTALELWQVSLVMQQEETVPVHSFKALQKVMTSSVLSLSSAEKECAVAVVNTTSTRDLASQTADLLERNGVYVIREDSMPLGLPVTVLQAAAEPQEACQTLLGKIRLFFPETGIIEEQDTETRRLRADIVILLGQDVSDPGQ